MEDRVVEGEAKLKGVRVAKRLLGVALGFFVGSEGLLGNLGALVAGGVLGDVAEEVGLHLEVKDLGLVAVRVGD